MATELKEKISRLERFNGGKGYYADVRMGEVFHVIDSVMSSSKAAPVSESDNR